MRGISQYRLRRIAKVHKRSGLSGLLKMAHVTSTEPLSTNVGSTLPAVRRAIEASRPPTEPTGRNAGRADGGQIG